MKRDFGPSALLPQVAHEMVTGMLRRHGNRISPQHSLALEQLMDGFTKQGLGITPGRRAYGLPCGSGKTLSVVAWTAAQHKLGLGLSVAVSAQQIDCLWNVKDALVAEGVPPSLIGIRHSLGNRGRWPDTGEEDCPIMLGSHSRIQRSDEMPSFCRHKGQPRDLLIWDESLISSDSRIVEIHDADRALSYFLTEERRRPLLKEIHERFLAKVDEELKRQRAGSEPSVFVLVTDEEFELAMTELAGVGIGKLAWASQRTAQEALQQFARPASVLSIGGGGNSGLVLMGYRIVVDPALENIAVLDASFVVSELCKADPTIRNATTAAMAEYKDHTAVIVKQTMAPSGRWQFSKAEQTLALTAAANSICSIPAEQNILVVTFLPRQGVDPEAALKRELRARGIDPDELRQGRRRISFTTWGKHTTDNTFSDVRHVVCLGVLRQSSASVAASMAGQKNNAAYRMTPEHLSEVELSLLASNIMQAMSRGNCRRVDAEGKALPMTLHLITKEQGLKAYLQKAMPGLQWETIDAKRPTRIEEAAQRIADYVYALPESEGRLSKRTIFSALGIQLASAAKAEAMAQAMVKLALRTITSDYRWVVVGQSLERRIRM